MKKVTTITGIIVAVIIAINSFAHPIFNNSKPVKGNQTPLSSSGHPDKEFNTSGIPAAAAIQVIPAENEKEDPENLLEHRIQTINIPSLQGSIIIDGKINEEIWEKAASFPHFTITAGKATGENARFKTECYAFRNKEKFYVSFVCFDPEINHLNNKITDWDDPDIIFDDRVAIFIDINHDHRNYIELAINPEGVQFDQKLFLRYPRVRTNESYPEWNCYWKGKTSKLSDRWIAEIEIDIRSLGVDNIEEGTTWGFNVARARRPEIQTENNWKKISENTEYSAWRLTRDGIWESLSNFHEPNDFGDLIFGGQDPDISNIKFKDAVFVFGGNSMTPSNTGINPLDIEFGSPVSANSGLLLSLATVSENGKRWESKNIIDTKNSKVYRTEYFIKDYAEPELTIKIIEDKTNKLLYETSYFLTVPPFIEFDLSSLYKRDGKDINPVGYRLFADQQTLDKSELEVHLYNFDNQRITCETLSNLKKTDQFQNIFDTETLRRLPGGNYYFQNILRYKNSHDTVTTFTQPFTKFDITIPQQFRAVEGPYLYGGMEGHSVQVLFPNRQRFVFWDKASYVPWWDVDQVALTYEFAEAWGFRTQGCAEPMQDRECRYSTVNIIENTPARIVIHWRYALADVHYRIYKNEWVDEFYCFYPDGVGIREVNLWANDDEIHEFFEIIPVNPPSMQEKDMFGDYVARLSNFSGDVFTTDDFIKDGNAVRNKLYKPDADILVEVILNNNMHPFAVVTFRDSVNPGVISEAALGGSREYSMSSHRGHWPASEYAIDGYNLVGNHRPTHGNIGSVKAKVNSAANPNTFTHMLGIAPKGTDDARSHGFCWLNPGVIIPDGSTLHYRGYDMKQRAYLLETEGKAPKLQFTLAPGKCPVKNPVFIIKGIRTEDVKTISINNKQLRNEEFQTGNSLKNECIIFISKTISESGNLEINL